MRFDTEQAFFRAVYRVAGFGPVDIADVFIENGRPIFDEKTRTDRAQDHRVALANIGVRLMRAAFHVHERAAAQIGPGDDLLGYRLDRAAEDLPEGWQIVIQARKGSINVDLYDPSDKRSEFGRGDDGQPSYLVSCAIDFAKACVPSRGM